MKHEITPKNILETQSRYVSAAYEACEKKESGRIQLEIKHMGEDISCYFISDGKKIDFGFGKINDYGVKLTAGLYDWLDLSSNRLHPVWGIITKKLKFEGNTKIFGKVIHKNLLYKIKADTYDPPTLFEKNPLKNWKKPEKVLIINGSPRGNNGYTYQYLNRFIKGFQNAGASIETIDLSLKKINPCIGCFHCWKNDTGKCIQNDDVNDLNDLFKESDLIIYAFPLYWDTIPGVLKNFIDRGFCLEHPYMIPGIDRSRHPRRFKKDQSFFVFSICGFPEQKHFDNVKEYFKGIGRKTHMPLLGGIYRSACLFLRNDPVYFKTYNQVLDSIEKAGEALFINGKIPNKILKAIHTKIDAKEFQIHSNKFWENVVLKDDYFASKV